MNKDKQIKIESQGTKPMAILAITLAFLSIYLFTSGVSEVPNKPLVDDMPTSAIFNFLVSILLGVLAKVSWNKATRE